MKLVMTLLVRDEQDILEDNLAFHRAMGVDAFIVTDNLSVDGTRDILRPWEQRGQLQVIDEPSDDYSQWRWVTRMARLAADEHDADWVIHADADEFWWPESGDLKTALAGVPEGCGLLHVPRNNFVVERSVVAEARSPGPRTLTLREVAERSYLGRPLAPKVCHRAHPDVIVEQGNHSVRGVDWETWSTTQPITILHYQMRGWDHFRNKIVKGGAAYARNTELAPNTGRGWRLLYERHVQGTLRDYYDEQLVSADDRAAGLAEGRYVVDRRLTDWFAAER